MDKFEFRFCFNTDGDFGIKYVPQGIECSNHMYNYRKVFNNRAEAVTEINDILNTVKQNLYGKDWVIRDVCTMIDNFLSGLEKPGMCEIFEDSLSGNYIGSFITFNIIPNEIHFNFTWTNEERDFILAHIKRILEIACLRPSL